LIDLRPLRGRADAGLIGLGSEQVSDAIIAALSAA